MQKNKMWILITTIILGLLIVATGVMTIITLSQLSSKPETEKSPAVTEPSTAQEPFEAGQCAQLASEEDSGAKLYIKECGSLLSDVLIAKIQTGECADPYLTFNNEGSATTYCLGLDAKEGDCFHFGALVDRALACTGDDVRRVLKVYDKVADGKQCNTVAGNVGVYAYVDPPKTLCFGSAD